MNLTWANVTVPSLVRAPLELWPAGDNITHWGQLRSCQYSEKSRDDMGFNMIQPYSTHLRQVIWDDLIDLIWWFKFGMAWWNVHPQLLRSSEKHLQASRAAQYWLEIVGHQQFAVQTALPKDGETFGFLTSNSQEKSQSNQTLLAVDEHHELWESDISFWFLSVPLNRQFSRLCFRHVSNSK